MDADDSEIRDQGLRNVGGKGKETSLLLIHSRRLTFRIEHKKYVF